MSCSRTQRSDAGDDRTSSPSISSQALYHLATAFPYRLIGLRHKVPVNNISVMPGLLTERGRKKKKIQWDILKCPDPHPNLPQMKQISSCQQSHLSEICSRECTTLPPKKSPSKIYTVNEVITIASYIPKLSYPKIILIQSLCQQVTFTLSSFYSHAKLYFGKLHVLLQILLKCLVFRYCTLLPNNLKDVVFLVCGFTSQSTAYCPASQARVTVSPCFVYNVIRDLVLDLH